ncbi:hypothetical protein B0H17DRAFT_914738 [Mycena rosella]|uniref:Uncharacterized protein n=1 Tax=Mycena rosella TaxID=1033263 RepID=A0AAD7H2J3_MYCRO|nr:hypothetical protein B0H17DRAFT_914738 [Mycena rosella]
MLVKNSSYSTESSTNTEREPRKRARTSGGEEERSRFWFPWRDRITCTLDILMHLPRSVFSHRQLDLFLWLLKVNQVDDVPSVKVMQNLNSALQKMCGIDSIPYNGALGHKYYVNSLPQIIAQEMANPNVRPHLSFYPEDSGPKLSEARQGQRWLKELPDTQTTPMLRIGQQDYFIHEPAMLNDGTCCIPTRWFMRGDQYFANCWELAPVVADDHSGWRVIMRSEAFVVPASEFLKNFPDFERDADHYGVPHPTSIIDVVDQASGTTGPWIHTDPTVGNKWRARAGGSRVVVFPLWMYCDDTSGNVSKKWNEHNSFLVTPAGLPRAESQKEYNIHFLSTSNIAPPLEMMDGIVDQLEQAQENGIWTWDVHLQEPVLVIPEVLALLGDNPMQSEFACHIGLRGKLFCRACWVKGTDALDPTAGSAKGSDQSDQSDAQASEAGSKTGKGKRKRVKETMTQMVNRVKAFITVGRLRTKQETTAKLRSFFTEASTIDTQTKIQNQRTESGVKDTYQLFFLEKLFESYKGKRGRAAKQAALNARLAALPKITMSPVWRIKGLDPHQDTPVEILHVVLLGFIKYLWRDLIQLQLKTKDDKKELLITRLSSLDVSGLGISPLAGRTLVQYSGSLTGRDFRSIAQVAPFVVYDLVSPECFETWQALSKLVPLIWQPEIPNIEPHIALLTKEIDNFLLCAAKWTNRWFNKPKFHIILHLPLHIRRFGPAILFATEAFESFNAIIRAKGVHSNRHAPSRDIAQAFAQGNRIRHLLSGGLFLLTSSDSNIDDARPFSRNSSDWKCVGAGPLHLVKNPNTITSYLGLDSKKKSAPGMIYAHPLILYSHISKVVTLFRTCKDVILTNGDNCIPGSFVIVKHPDRIGETFVARVEEIIQEVGSVASHSSLSDGIMVQKVHLLRERPRYGMPGIVLTGERQVLQTLEILCTVNVQHNCLDNNCGPTTSRPVYQERQITTHTQAQIAHLVSPTDLVLNTAQMRDAVHVQRFRIDTPAMEQDTVIHQSAANELEAAKTAAKSTTTAGCSQNRTRSTPAVSTRARPSQLARVRALDQ